MIFPNKIPMKIQTDEVLKTENVGDVMQLVSDIHKILNAQKKAML